MTAEVTPAEVYYVWCDPCATNTGPFDEEVSAHEWAATHDAENHEDDDPDEIARQEWRDSRDD